jgi:hypothetical protein
MQNRSRRSFVVIPRLAMRWDTLLADTMRAFASGVADPRVGLKHRVEHHREDRIGLVGSKLPVHNGYAAVGAARQRLVVVPKVQLGERFVLIWPSAAGPLDELVGLC